MVSWYLLVGIISAVLITFIPSVSEVNAQTTIEVPTTTPCFLNFNSTHQMWDRCNAEEDFLEFALRPFQWVTGGYFSLIIVSILIIFTYVKYNNALYPVVIGTMFLPVSYFVFPDTFLSHALILVAIGLAAAITVGLVRLTKEYDG